MRWLLLIALAGCFTTHEVEIPGSVHVVEDVAGPPDTIALTVTASYGTLHVDAARPRFCYREVRQFVEHREETDVGAGWSGGGGVIGAIVAAGASSLASAAVNAGADSQLEDKTLSTTKTDCSIPAAGATIAVALPSGAVVRVRTDSRGLAHIKIPAGEPASGTAIVRAGETAVRVGYSP